MSVFIDNPAIGVVTVVLVSTLLFAPTIVANLRKVYAFRSVSALNALTLLLVVGFWVPGFFIGGFSPLFVLSAIVTCITAMVWSLAGTRRNP
jgi:hypothetical protein